MKNGRDDVELQAILYANRAAANFHLENYGSSLYDAQEALKHKPDHVKAIARGRFDLITRMRMRFRSLI